MALKYDWAAPAKLFFWPAEDGSEEECVYPTLDDALKAAGEGDADHAWIITRDGDILNPRVIATLREELAERRRRKRDKPFSFLGWARAA
ncbi:hypothetical protein [uncultured Enterovirga sp.]|uniref:hypothetical protein n=1 Tax=uncultured Enterovirga sp. TaxID=2026352 RepID=UPI0035CAE238